MVDRVVLIRPRGFCAGVERAVDTVDEVLREFGAPIYVKHEIVHNKAVVDGFKARGVVFVEELSEVPDGSVCVFSAHGIAPSVVEEAKSRNLSTIDATCPLVTKIHVEVARFARDGSEIIYIGHRGHPEAIGVMGVRPDITHLVEKPEEVAGLKVTDEDNLVYLTQTTLSVDECQAVIDALKARFPRIKAPPSSDICYATTNRQGAIKAAAKVCDVIIVVGSKNSSNSNRLVETARELGVDAHLVDGLGEIEGSWLEGKRVLGLSGGASAPENLIQEIADSFRGKGARIEELTTVEENMKFVMPRELASAHRKQGV